MTEWQWRNRISTNPALRWDSLGAETPTAWWAQMEYRHVQVVKAEDRGDQCYANKRGWYWHVLDENSGIDTTQVWGPFPTAAEALEASRYNQRKPYPKTKPA